MNNLCGDRGPRIGQDITTCWRPKRHQGLHQAHPSWANGNTIPTWNDTACSDRAAYPDLLGFGDSGMDVRSDLQELLQSLKNNG